MKRINVDASAEPVIPKDVLDIIAQRFADAIDAQIIEEMLA